LTTLTETVARVSSRTSRACRRCVGGEARWDLPGASTAGREKEAVGRDDDLRLAGVSLQEDGRVELELARGRSHPAERAGRRKSEGEIGRKGGGTANAGIVPLPLLPRLLPLPPLPLFYLAEVLQACR
jgi:hypothetical protein